MNADTLKAFFTYLTALIVVVGGIAVIYFSRNDGPAAAQVQLLIGGFIGSALTFLFVQENSTRTARASERQFAQGSNSTSPTTVNATGDTTVQGGDPTNVKVGDK